MQEIVDKYNTPFLQASPYLLPIIKTPNTEKARQQYKNKLYMVNTHLKQVGELIDLPIPLSTYVARHSWASIAKTKTYLFPLSAKVWGTVQKPQRKSILLP